MNDTHNPDNSFRWLHDRLQTRSRRRSTALFFVGVLASLVLVTWLGVSYGGLNDRLADVERARAQVVNVLERQVATQAQWAAQPDGPDKNAELTGAESRVRVERRRYDEAASAYNADVTGFPRGLLASLFGLPEKLLLSHEVDQW